MIISHLQLKNWRNFRKVDVKLGQRMFIVGPNASGKSNLLDVFRFLRDVAKAGGGLQTAVADRGGLSKIRCLAARQEPDVEIDIKLSNNPGNQASWRYAVGIKQEVRGSRRPLLRYEKVWQDDVQILDRPDKSDEEDPERMTQTHLEQISTNVKFREISRLIESIHYLHVVPQLLRHPKAFSGRGLPDDPFGRDLLLTIGKATPKTRQSRLHKIGQALKIAVPQLSQLDYVIASEEGGIPHLEALYKHWRPYGAKQREQDFSDGTLRLIGLLWSLLEGDAPLLLEEPELSLNVAIVRKLPGLMHRLTQKNKRQVILSTHSKDLLDDRGIGSDEILLLVPDQEGTKVEVTSDDAEIEALLNEGMSPGEAVIPKTEPPNSQQLLLFPV